MGAVVDQPSSALRPDLVRDQAVGRLDVDRAVGGAREVQIVREREDALRGLEQGRGGGGRRSAWWRPAGLPLPVVGSVGVTSGGLPAELEQPAAKTAAAKITAAANSLFMSSLLGILLRGSERSHSLVVQNDAPNLSYWGRSVTLGPQKVASQAARANVGEDQETAGKERAPARASMTRAVVRASDAEVAVAHPAHHRRPSSRPAAAISRGRRHPSDTGPGAGNPVQLAATAHRGRARSRPVCRQRRARDWRRCRAAPRTSLSSKRIGAPPRPSKTVRANGRRNRLHGGHAPTRSPGWRSPPVPRPSTSCFSIPRTTRRCCRPRPLRSSPQQPARAGRAHLRRTSRARTAAGAAGGLAGAFATAGRARSGIIYLPFEIRAT